MPFSKSRFRTRAAGEAVANPEVLLLLDAGSTVALIFRPNVLQESTGRCSDEEGITPTIAVPPALLQAERGRAPRGRMVVADRATVVVQAPGTRTLDPMSRGLGRIERAILDLIEDEDACEQCYAADDLARAVYQRGKSGRPTQSEHVAALRAMHSLARKYPNKFVLTGGRGRGRLWLERHR